MLTINLANPSLLCERAYINGKWIQAQSGEVFSVFNPANGESLNEFMELKYLCLGGMR